MTKDAKYWIERLQLTPHPEGGFFRETYRSEMAIAKAGLPAQFSGARRASTAIYFLLEGEDFSAFHRLRSDEVWHFYAGSSLAVQVIAEDGRQSEIHLGSDPEAGLSLQAWVKGGCWFASQVRDRQMFALVGCTVAPGFEFDDFEMGGRAKLVALFPQHRELIERFTRG